MKQITGRDAYIISRALAYAIQAIDALSPEWQEASDQNDMKRILINIVDSDFELEDLLRSVRRHITQKVE